MVLYAKDIVEKDFVSMDPSVNVLAAAKIMRERRHGFVMVSSEGGKPQGIVTEWDLLSKVMAEGRDPTKLTLRDVMTSELVAVRSDDGIDQVAQVMTVKGVRRVLVMEKNEMIGVITSKTILARMKEYVDKISSQISRLQGPWF